MYIFFFHLRDWGVSYRIKTMGKGLFSKVRRFFRAKKQKANVIGWWCHQCLSPANQIAFFSVRATGSRKLIRLVENRF